jgi:hypothetical protein
MVCQMLNVSVDDPSKRDDTDITVIFQSFKILSGSKLENSCDLPLASSEQFDGIFDRLPIAVQSNDLGITVDVKQYWLLFRENAFQLIASESESAR